MFTWNPRARPATSFTGSDDGSPGGLWTASPSYDWADNPAGTAASYVTAPLGAEHRGDRRRGRPALDQGLAPSVDLQVTISEVRPDGKETFVQDGWLRASERKLDAATSTLLEPVLSLRRADAASLPRRPLTAVTVPLYYEGHVYRRGSRIRLTVAAPGGDQPVWAFAELSPRGPATVTIAHSSRYPSRLVLPVVPGVAVPTGLPPCPGPAGRAVPALHAAGQSAWDDRRCIDEPAGTEPDVPASR